VRRSYDQGKPNESTCDSRGRKLPAFLLCVRVSPVDNNKVRCPLNYLNFLEFKSRIFRSRVCANDEDMEFQSAAVRGHAKAKHIHRIIAAGFLPCGYSAALKNTLRRHIAACQAFDAIGLPIMPYIAAWRIDTADIWYEFVSRRFLAFLLQPRKPRQGIQQGRS